MSLRKEELCVYSKARFDALPSSIRKFFRFFYSNEVQLMQFDKMPYFPKERSFISYVLYLDEIKRDRERKEIYLINTSRDSFSGGLSLSETVSNLRSKYEYKNSERPLLQSISANYRYVRILEILTFLHTFEKNNLFQMKRIGYSGFGENSGDYLLFRLSNNFSVGLRNYKNVDSIDAFDQDKIQLGQFLLNYVFGSLGRDSHIYNREDDVVETLLKEVVEKFDAFEKLSDEEKREQYELYRKKILEQNKKKEK